MNPHEIDRLLRESPPEPTPRPGLESRIRAALQGAPRPASPLSRWFAGIAAATGVAALLGVFGWVASRPAPPSGPPVVDRNDKKAPAESPGQSIAETLREDPNPLRSEARAIRQDASRAGRFLLDCLPSLAEK